MTVTGDYRRIDVFSLKGGVGKTTFSILLAEVQKERGQSALVIDADFTGTCIGHLLARSVDWANPANLAHLVCGRPERLDELLREQLPVYLLDDSRGDSRPLRLENQADAPHLLYCPSFAQPTNRELPAVHRQVLQAHLNQEGAGRYVSIIINKVAEAAKKKVPNLATVIVDHGPGMGALQYANLKNCNTNRHRAVFITSRDTVDIRAIQALEVSIAAEFGSDSDDPTRSNTLKPKLKANGVLTEGKSPHVLWVVNKVPGNDLAGWHRQICRQEEDLQRWIGSYAYPLFQDDRMAASYSDANRLSASKENQGSLAAIFNRLTG